MMDDTDRPDPILKQVPLIKNPCYQPPKPINLNTNYSKLIPSLSNTVVPPKLNITQVEIDAWIREIQAIEKRLKDAVENDKDIEKYNEWIHGQSIKVAPGFDYGVMQPHRAEPLVPEIENDSLVETNEKQQHQHKDVDDDVNELDRIFGKTTI